MDVRKVCTALSPSRKKPRTAAPVRMIPTKFSGSVAVSCGRPRSSVRRKLPEHCTISPLTRIHSSTGCPPEHAVARGGGKT
jgi:hypothetical protein